MEYKYYAYYKPNSKVELMNDIKQQLSEEYDSLTVHKLLSQIFNNINNNDTDEYLCSEKQNDIVLIKFTLVNKIFTKINTVDKTQYTLVSKTVDWVGKKIKNNNYQQQYIYPQNHNYNHKSNSILFNGSTCNYQNNENTEYIFTEYLTIPINNLLSYYKYIEFDTYTTFNTTTSTFNKSLLKYENNNMLNDKIIKNILILLNTLLSSTPINYNRDYHIITSNNNGFENLLSSTIIPYKNENDPLVIQIWNDIYKQPDNVYDVFTNYTLIINNEIKYKINDLKSYIETINFKVYSYLYITQKQFTTINYKDALPFRLAFDTKVNYNCQNIDIKHNKYIDEINNHTNEITKINILLEKLLRTKTETDNSIIKQNQYINYHQNEINTLKTNLLKINPYFKEHLLYTTNTGLKLTFECELNGYKSLLYLRYVCNNYSKLMYNQLNNQLNNQTNDVDSHHFLPDLLFLYDNITDKRNDIFEFYVSKKVLNELINMKLQSDLFTLSRLFTITPVDKYKDNDYKINNHETNKTYEISNKTSKTYHKLCRFLDKNINLKLFDYQKNNLLWMLELEDKINKQNLIIDTYSNPYTLVNFDYYSNTIIDNVKLFIYNLKAYIPEVLNKNYSIMNDNQKYYINMKNSQMVTNTKSLLVSVNSNNKHNYNRSLYNNDFNIIDSIVKPDVYKKIYNKQIDFCGGAICDEVGLGKTLTIISHLVIKLKHDMLTYNNYKTEVIDLLKKPNLEQSEVFNDPLDKGFEFNNLIIVPSRLTSQWESEIEKYVKDKFNLRAKVLVGINNIKSLEKELDNFTTQQYKLKKQTSKSETYKPIIVKSKPIKSEVIIDTNINNSKTNDSIPPIKLSQSQIKINKLMLKAQQNNIKNESKKLITFNKLKHSTKINNDANDDTKTHTLQTTLDNLININIDTNSDPINSEPINNVSIDDNKTIDSDDTYYYANTYLDCHNSTDKTVECDDYMLEQLYDVYIVSINLLSNDNYLNYINHLEDNNLQQYYEGENESMIKQNQIKAFKTFHDSKLKNDKTNDKTNYKSNKSTKTSTNNICRLSNVFNIFKIKWNRIILDEAHEKLSPTVKFFSSSVSKIINREKSLTHDSQFLYENLCSLQANYKWAMTGTPTEKGIDTLAGLVQFVSKNRANDTTIEKISKIRYLRDTSGISTINMDSLLNTIFKKTYKKDVKTLLKIPIFTEDIIYIEQTNIERNIYNSIRASRHLSDIVKTRTLFLMCTNILINNEIYSENTEDINNSIEPEVLTLEQLNSNMISKFNKQLKELDVMKLKLTKNNVELQNKLHQWIQLLNYIKSLNLDEKINPLFLDEINSKFKNLEDNRIRSQCEIIYSILCAFNVSHNPESLKDILSNNLYIIKDHLYHVWNRAWNNNEFIPLKCAEYATMLGHIHIKTDINKNFKNLNTYESDKLRINNQITLFSNNDFIKEKTQDPCIICFDDLKEIVVTSCRHIFCLHCAKKLSNNLISKFNCPECRNSIDAKTLNITNINMIDKKEDAIVDKVNDNDVSSNDSSASASASDSTELTILEKKLGKDWQNKCINKYGSKMCKLVEYLHTIFDDPKNRVIIFSQYDKMLKMIAKTLTEFNIKFVHCSGNNYVVNKNIMKFKKDDSYRVILLSSENANSGSNLTETNHILTLDVLQHDIEQTKAIEGQLVARAVRLGQCFPVKVVRFITKGTIEEEHFNENRYDINIFQN